MGAVRVHLLLLVHLHLLLLLLVIHLLLLRIPAILRRPVLSLLLLGRLPLGILLHVCLLGSHLLSALLGWDGERILPLSCLLLLLLLRLLTAGARRHHPAVIVRHK